MKKALSVILRLILGIGIIVGAVWTYFHYFRGRIYRPRLEIIVSGKITNNNGILFIITKIRIKNVGLSKIDIKQKGTGMRIIGLEKIHEVKEFENIIKNWL